MATLKNRNIQIPNGMKFSVPELKWTSPPYASFNTIVNSVLSLFRANAALAQERGWPTSKEGVEKLVEEYNAAICQSMGWTQYINEAPPGDTPPPKSLALTQLRQSGNNAVVGAKTLFDWLVGGGKPVARELARSRAKVCADCLLNKPGDMANFFQRATAELIRRQVGAAQDVGLTTPHDTKLGVCHACSCPLRLKVHVPLDAILRNMPREDKAALDSNCWILKEQTE